MKYALGHFFFPARALTSIHWETVDECNDANSNNCLMNANFILFLNNSTVLRLAYQRQSYAVRNWCQFLYSRTNWITVRFLVVVVVDFFFRFRSSKQQKKWNFRVEFMLSNCCNQKYKESDLVCMAHESISFLFYPFWWLDSVFFFPKINAVNEMQLKNAG